MKTYKIKYETISGNVRCVEVTGYSDSHAISKLYDSKEIYWIETI